MQLSRRDDVCMFVKSEMQSDCEVRRFLWLKIKFFSGSRRREGSGGFFIRQKNI